MGIRRQPSLEGESMEVRLEFPGISHLGYFGQNSISGLTAPASQWVACGEGRRRYATSCLEHSKRPDVWMV